MIRQKITRNNLQDRAIFNTTRIGYFDLINDNIGYGRKYGETSYNGRPIKAKPLGSFNPKSVEIEMSGLIPSGIIGDIRLHSTNKKRGINFILQRRKSRRNNLW